MKEADAAARLSSPLLVPKASRSELHPLLVVLLLVVEKP